MPSSFDTIASPLPFAMALAALAGGVDAIGIVLLAPTFVSFMSGNTTQLGVSLAALDETHAFRATCVLLTFITGVVSGELLATRVRPRLRSAVLLAVVASGLSGAAVCAKRGPELSVALLLTLSMGIQNAVVRRAGGIDVALTYVTGTLVHLSRAMAAAILGKGDLKRTVPFAALWIAFFGGALLGSLASRLGICHAIGAAAAIAATLATLALRPLGSLK